MLLAAAVVVFILGLLHSGLAEPIIFRHLPKVPGLPSLGFPPIVAGPDPAHRSLRATWHNLTILGWMIAVVLARFGTLPALTSGERFVVQAISVSLAASSVLWFVGTRGKHLGWVGFLAAAILCWLA